jgi:hypothetical protein
MDNPETQETLGIQEAGRRQTRKQLKHKIKKMSNRNSPKTVSERMYWRTVRSSCVL